MSLFVSAIRNARLITQATILARISAGLQARGLKRPGKPSKTIHQPQPSKSVRRA